MAGDDEVGFLVPGGWVKHPGQPDWGNGQIQSVIDNRITINFEHRGKVVIDRFQIDLEAVEPE